MKLKEGSPLAFHLTDGSTINAGVEYIDEHRPSVNMCMGLSPSGSDVRTLFVRFYIDQKDLMRLVREQDKYKRLTINHDGNAYSVSALSCWEYSAHCNFHTTTAIGWADCVCYFAT